MIRWTALICLLSVSPTALMSDDFNPKDLDHLEMFLESVKGLAVATNTSQEAYAATGENTVLDQVWSDKDRFPHGTIRWWQDQSPYTNDKKIRPSRVFKTGRDIRLYEVGRAAKDADVETRRLLRAEHAAPLLTDLETWLEDQSFLPKSLIGQAATYTRNQWQALNRYVEDGDLSIDNNAAERAMKPVAIGRKNWLFIGSKLAGQRASVLMTLMASCKRNQVEPFAWLRSILVGLATGAELEGLVPAVWLQSSPAASRITSSIDGGGGIKCDHMHGVRMR